MSEEDYDDSAVLILEGRHKGRIANHDDDQLGRAICYFGSMLVYEVRAYIPKKHIRPVNTNDLMTRRDEIFRLIGSHCLEPPTPKRKLDLLHEYHFISSVLTSRWNRSQEAIKVGSGKRIFVSHSSKDKQLATWIAVDLANHGHLPWLDQWEIRVGDSIPTKIGEGLDNCDAVVILLSPHAVSSGWVEREWQAKYWDEIESGKVMVLPALLEDCVIPSLLKMKRYADFRYDFNYGLSDLSDALRSRDKPNAEQDVTPNA